MGKRILAVLLVLLLALPILPACGKKNGPSGEDGPADSIDNSTTEQPFNVDYSTYRQSYIADIVREVSSEDVVRDRAYTVDDAKVEALIDMLDFAVNSVEFKQLLDVDLGSLLQQLTEKIYSNDVVNLAVQYLYPLVETEFAKVWAGLPESLEIKDVETGVAVAPKANVSAALYIDEIEKALESISFYLFPSTLSAHLPEEFSSVAQKLKQATVKSKYDPETNTMTTPWQDPAILTADGKLDLDWGVHDRDSFISAISAALSGVEPLLLALLSNIACDNRGLIGTGEGHAAIAANVVKLDMQITSIELVLTATANPGYNNTVVPILETLDIPAPDGNSFTCMRDVVEHGLIEPLETLLERLSKAPIDFVLRALPNIAYAVEGQMIVPLLSMLKTEINYTTNAKYTVQIAGDGEMNDAYKSDEPIKINVGEMIDLASMGVDLSSLNGLLKLAEKPLGVALPAIDGAKLATLGALSWRHTVRNETTYHSLEEGRAAYIEANRADVLLFLLEYVLEGLKDKALLSGILGKLTDGDALPEFVNAVIDRVTSSPHNTIAALTELLVPQDYQEPNSVKWKTAAAPLGTAASLYSDYWTHAKAQYMVQNLPSLIDNFLQTSELNIAGITASSLPGLLSGLESSICKAQTLNDLASKIAGVMAKVSLPSAVTQLLKEKLGVDVSFWNYYHADFADGDRAAFKTAVGNLLYPIQKVVTFLLSNEDITLSLTAADGKTVKLLQLHGFDGYALAVAPLLEALGADNLPTPAAFKADPSHAFSFILDAVFGIIDALKTDPYQKLTVLLPNVLCFIRYGSLTAVMDNLLYPVQLVLDIIRPIYNLDLNSLVDFDLRFEQTDPIQLLFGLLSDVLQKQLGITAKFAGTTESLYNGLVTGTVETFTSVNGATAYRVNEASINKEDMLTFAYDGLLRELLFSDNTPAYLQFAKEKLGLSDKVFSYVEKILPGLQNAETTYPGAGKALIFWVFFAAEAYMGASSSSGGGSVFSILMTLLGSSNAEKRDFAKSELQYDISRPGFSDVLTGILQPLFR
ncbi:MAG: hypothetical protein IJT27_01700 [Clostridia bacterium]|nr:hypothetical protein [Clostridia bacterium]